MSTSEQKEELSPPPSIVVYWGSGSPPAWRVLACLEEKNLAYKSERISFDSGVLRSPSFLSLNPRGLVPILVDKDVKIYESLAIIMYLEMTYPEKSLLPKDPAVRAKVLMRMQEANNVSSAGGEIIYYLRRTHPDDINQEYLDAKHSALEFELKLWESYLVGSEFLAGAGQPFSLADLAFFPNLAYLVRLGLRLDAKYPNLASYFKRLCKRPTILKTWPPHWKGTSGLPLLRSSDDGAPMPDCRDEDEH